MSTWRVSREEIEVFNHPGADRLELANAGGFQLVVQKGLRKTGDIVIVIPHNSMLPLDNPIFDSFKPYLAGPNKNRVRSQNIRGELSAAIAIDDQPEFADVPLGEDICERLKIIKYEPVIPAQLAGKVKPIGRVETGGVEITKHDCEQFNLYINEFEPNEPVMVTEKLHGSQIIVIRTKDGRRLISSKGLLGRMLTIEEEEGNTYWRAARTTKIFDLLDHHYPNVHVQAFGECVPVQSGFSYGFSSPTALWFRIDVNGETQQYPVIPEDIRKQWVPIITENIPFNPDELRKHRSGYETVSGKNTNIREGVVVTPIIPRKSRKGFNLILKIINPAYKESGEEFN